MKFYCDNCQTKYSIADEKVRGKVLKIRCKKCSEIITVREPKRPDVRRSQSQQGGSASSAPQDGGRKQPRKSKGSKAPPPAPPPSPPRQVEWHYSVNGQSFGPVSKQELDDMLAGGELGDATYVWNETYTDWKRVKGVDAFSEALQKARQVRKPKKTHGVSQALEAIDRKQADEARDDGAEERRTDRKEPDGDDVLPAGEDDGDPSFDSAKEPSSPEVEQPTAQSDDDEDRSESRKERLENLRERLELGAKRSRDGQDDARPDEESDDDEPDPGDDGGGASLDETQESSYDFVGDFSELEEMVGSSSEDDESDAGREHREPMDDDLGAEDPGSDEPSPQLMATEPMTPSAGTEVKSDHGAETVPFGEQSSNARDVEPADPDIPEGVDGNDGLLSDIDGDEEQEVDGEEDAVPFASAAPRLGDDDDPKSSSRVDEMTESLLIQLSEIQEGGRKRTVVGVVGALAAFGVFGLIAFLVISDAGQTEEVVEEDDGPRMDHVGGRPEFREYSPDELARVSDRLVVDEPLEITREESKAAYERDEAAQGGGAAAGAETAGGGDDDGVSGGMPDIDPERFQRRDDGADGLDGDRAESGRTGSRFGSPRIASSGDGDGDGDGDQLAGMDEADLEETRSRFEAMGAVETDRDREIFRGGEGEEIERGEVQDGLSGEQIADGVQRVRQSVGSCRERHIFRGGDLEVDQIEVSLTVLPSGDITQFVLRPDDLDDTDFQRCMESHTGRWRFPRFRGDPVEIEAPFALR